MVYLLLATPHVLYALCMRTIFRFTEEPPDIYREKLHNFTEILIGLHTFYIHLNYSIYSLHHINDGFFQWYAYDFCLLFYVSGWMVIFGLLFMPLLSSGFLRILLVLPHLFLLSP